jgi:hypothetical protein
LSRVGERHCNRWASIQSYRFATRRWIPESLKRIDWRNDVKDSRINSQLDETFSCSENRSSADWKLRVAVTAGGIHGKRANESDEVSATYLRGHVAEEVEPAKLCLVGSVEELLLLGRHIPSRTGITYPTWYHHHRRHRHHPHYEWKRYSRNEAHLEIYFSY